METKSSRDTIKSIMDYESYLNLLKQKAEVTDVENLSDDEKEKLPNIKLNYQRSSRIHRTYKVDESVKNAIPRITEPQQWIIISETWCGDSAQNVPYLVEMAKLNLSIDLKVVLRDLNPEFMDMYLTSETRSIPKLIAFNEAGEEIFQWGPRPKEGQELVTRLKTERKSKTEFLEQLHLWYGRNRGKALESEMVEILNSL